MTNLHESYLAGFGFNIASPGLMTDYRSAALPTCMCACMRVMDRRKMEGFVDLNVCDPACMCVTLCVRMD